MRLSARNLSWSAGGASTLHGLLSRGFPNCFIVSNVQSGFSANFPHMINEQSKHIGYILRHCADRQVRLVEPSQEAEDAWVKTIEDLAIMRQAFLEECESFDGSAGTDAIVVARDWLLRRRLRIGAADALEDAVAAGSGAHDFPR